MPVEEDDGKGGGRRTEPRAPGEEGDTARSPDLTLGNLYMRRFVLGMDWVMPGASERRSSTSG